MFSALIDIVFIYCFTFLAHQLIIRLVFIDLFTVFAVTWLFYYPGLYILLKGRTLAKVITGLKVVRNNGGEIQISQILIRELPGKFFIFVVIPAYLANTLHFYKRSQLLVPSVILVAVIILMLVLFFIFKRTWWEQVSSTKSTRYPVNRSSLRLISLMTIFIIYALTIFIKTKPVFIGGNNLSATFYPSYPVNAETREYADFIKSHSKDPVDYIFGLFDRYDLVVLDERMHEEYTQYDLITKIVSDQRFAEKIGNIYTEIGSVSFQDDLNNYLSRDFTNEDSLNKATAILLRSCNPIWPLWGCTNMYDLLKHVNGMNNHSDDNHRINWYFTDMPVNWETMTPAKWQAEPKDSRDRIMADNIIKIYKKKTATNESKKKGLVIMDVRHAFGLIRDNKGRKTDHYFNETNTTAFLMDLLPGKTCNVLINSVPFGLGVIFTPTQHGKWDKAFELAGDPDAGFDFAGSPFGLDKFDNLLGSPPEGLKYQDVFTGFIFYKPLEQHIRKTGYPYLLYNFEDSLMRRSKCLGPGYDESVKTILRIYKDDKIYTDGFPYAFFYNAIINFGYSVIIFLTFVICCIFYFKK